MRLLLALLLAFGCVSPGLAQNKPKKPTSQKSVSSLQKKRNQLRNQRAALQKQIKQNKAMTRQTIAQIAKVDAQIAVVEEALEETTVKLNESKAEQRVVGVELKQATDRLTTVREQLRQRLRRMYMAGPTSTLSVVLKSRTAGELASRTEQLSMVARSDRSAFSDYRSARNHVAAKKREADAIVVKVSDLASRQKAWETRLHDSRQEKQKQVKALQRDRAKLEATLAQLDSDMRQITSQIQAFLRARKRTMGGKPIPPFIGRFLRPVPTQVTSKFGYRFHPILKRSRLHAGVDLAGNTGDPVKAAAGGEVIAAQYMRGYGNTVIIDHGGEVATVYAHLSRIGVSSGQRVKQGQRIGNVGSTGLSTAPHLHWEVRVKGNPVNPMGRL